MKMVLGRFENNLQIFPLKNKFIHKKIAQQFPTKFSEWNTCENLREIETQILVK
jgi:hypothetical protein